MEDLVLEHAACECYALVKQKPVTFVKSVYLLALAKVLLAYHDNSIQQDSRPRSPIFAVDVLDLDFVGSRASVERFALYI